MKMKWNEIHTLSVYVTNNMIKFGSCHCHLSLWPVVTGGIFVAEQVPCTPHLSCFYDFFLFFLWFFRHPLYIKWKTAFDALPVLYLVLLLTRCWYLVIDFVPRHGLWPHLCANCLSQAPGLMCFGTCSGHFWTAACPLGSSKAPGESLSCPSGEV